MRRTVLGCTVLLACAAALAACTSSADQDADTTQGAGMTAGAAPAGATVPSLTEWAGTWDGRSMQGDSVVATWRLVGTADTTGWTITFPEGQPMPVRILAVAGDSVVAEFGPYRGTVSGEQVTVRSVGRLESQDRQAGTYEARPTTRPDSVSRGRWEATRVP